MSTPYRDPSGVSRCDALLQARDENGLSCGGGCGEWIAASSISRLLGATDLVAVGKPAPYFKVTAADTMLVV